MINIKLFGIAREIVGNSDLKIVEPLTTVEDLLSYLKSTYPEFNKLKSLLVAINDEYARETDLIKQEDELAIIPPVSGG